MSRRAKLLLVSLGFGSTATFQFYRTERWLARLQAIYNGEYKGIGNFDDLFDYVLAFFLSCHHVKDWLKNGSQWHDELDPHVKAAAIEQFVSENECLRICADICNGNKHFHLDRELRSGTAPAFGHVHTKIDCDVDPPMWKTHFTLRTVRGDTDALELAQQCTESWRQFIRGSTEGLLRDLASRNRRNKKTRH
jgi:hypothetical protein